ncbi:uncharacterized protein F5891DRAFT_1200295 [Suillus fuscotomentosus]|uniref:Uncharacterized protein n=1 Tax=Suillus fuscotomentosus TaxID=1912939 RepID=A0AAD4DQY5_9AGAM|nr:uncharacterized protein F5891DRAFT_1200295 [Suillus fuscotomentosus]KAG1886933.1 hypothetical protein F5891DRAFT_1200295 [Suillus fuscotomentosus]
MYLSAFQAKAVNKPLVDVEGVHRIQPGFFDDHVNSSTSPSHCTAAPRQSMQPSRLSSHNLLSLAQNFISGMLRRRDGSAIWLPPVVEVLLTAGKPRNYHARKKPSTSSSQPPKPPTMQQHNGGATQSNLPSSQQPNTTATASVTSNISYMAPLSFFPFVLALVCLRLVFLYRLSVDRILGTVPVPHPPPIAPTCARAFGL